MWLTLDGRPERDFKSKMVQRLIVKKYLESLLRQRETDEEYREFLLQQGAGDEDWANPRGPTMFRCPLQRHHS